MPSGCGQVQCFVEATAARIARASALLGEQVALDASVLERGDDLSLTAPGLWSASRSCRLIPARDGWIAANLPRQDDLDSLPALLGPTDAASDCEGWDWLIAQAGSRPCDELVSRAEMLGLAIAIVGERSAPAEACAAEIVGRRADPPDRLRVVDFSSLWAGPLCGAVFAALGADVVKVESVERPDTTASAAPLLDKRLNGGKRRRRVSIAAPEGMANLIDDISRCDVLITSARARALGALGLTREELFAANPGLIWIAITGHGWGSNRIALGDDAAAAGGLVAWEDQQPSFLGDALADPLTGIAAAAQALDMVALSQAGFIDAALSSTAAFVAKRP